MSKKQTATMALALVFVSLGRGSARAQDTGGAESAPVTSESVKDRPPSVSAPAYAAINEEAIKLGLHAWIGKQPTALAEAMTAKIEKGDVAGAKARVDKLKSVLSQEYLNHQKEQLDEIEKGDSNETRTTASVIFLPELRVAQPALIQSFSLRNLFHPFMDHAEELRVTAKKRLLDGGLIHLQSSGPAGEDVYETGVLTDDQLTLLCDSIAQAQLKENELGRPTYAKFLYWLADAISLDVGLTLGSTAFGEKGAVYTAKVDKDFPQFLFGLGLHFDPVEFSTGVELYRTPADKFKTSVYFGISVQVFAAHFNLSSSSK